jgi:ankyrin repeat protein
MCRQSCYAWAGLGIILLVSGCGPSMALHEAIEEGQTEKALTLIAEGKCLKDVTYDGDTPLHYAAHYGNAEVAKALIDAGVDLEPTTRTYRFKPLYYAASRGHVAVSRLLVEKGANVESENARGGSALLLASLNGHTAVAQLLIEHGADMNRQVGDNTTPLVGAARFGHVSTVKLLLEKGADPNIREPSGGTPLLAAAVHKKTEVVRLMAESRANVRAADNRGYTPLMASARGGDLESVKLLIEKGSEIEAQFSENSMSALHYAAFADQAETVQYLLTAGARFYPIEEGAGTYSTAVLGKWCGHRGEVGGSPEEAVKYYALAGRYYDKAVGYFEGQAAEMGKRVDKMEAGNFMRQFVASMAVGMAAAGGGFGYASYRVEDASKLQQVKKAQLEKAAQCRQLADVCRKLGDCYEEHASDPKAREEYARMLKDQLGLR